MKIFLAAILLLFGHAEFGLAADPTCQCGARHLEPFLEMELYYAKHEYPMFVYLQNENDDSTFCGGVVISPRYILTAASCVTNRDPDDVQVAIGDPDLNNNRSPIRFVEKLIAHPQFNAATSDYDIGLVKLDSDMEFTHAVSPVCLPFYLNKDQTDKDRNLSGANVFILEAEKKNNRLASAVRNRDFAITDQQSCPQASSRQLCTNTSDKNDCKPCSAWIRRNCTEYYDIGSPVLYTEPRTKRLFVVGIVSKLIDCKSEQPGVNTRVTELMDWIVQTAPSDYCVV